MPKANRTPTPGWSQMAAYVGYQSNFSNNTQWETRIDHSITDNSRLTLRFNRQNSVGGYSSWYNELDPGNQNSVPGALNGSLGWTWMVSPTTILELRGSVTYSPGNGGYFWPNNESDWPIDPVMMALTGGSPGGDRQSRLVVKWVRLGRLPGCTEPGCRCGQCLHHLRRRSRSDQNLGKTHP